MSSADRSLRRAGFTLIELLVAVMLSAILATIIFQMVRGQTRFTQMQGAREEVDQNTRGALELISSELRAVPSAGIVSAGATQITFRLPRVWGILCAPATSSQALAVFPPANSTTPADLPTAAADLAANQGWGIAIQRGTTNGYQAYTINGSAAAQATCDANLGAPVDPKPVARGYTYTTLLPPASDRGSRVFVYQTITYDAATSTDAAIPGVWLRRTNGYKSPQQQPLAGPLDTRDSLVPPLKFRYFCNGAEIAPANLVTEAGRNTITAIEVQLGMMSRESTRSVQQSERDTQLIHLRNTGTVTCL